MEDTAETKDTYYQRNREKVLARAKDNYRKNRLRVTLMGEL